MDPITKARKFGNDPSNEPKSPSHKNIKDITQISHYQTYVSPLITSATLRRWLAAYFLAQLIISL